MRAISALAIACAIATPAFPQTQQQIPAPTIVGIKAGETLQLYTFSAVTRSCAVLYKGFDGLDVLDGDPDLSVEYWEKRVEFTTASGKRCENVPVGVFLLTASKDITEAKESNLTIRFRYRTRSGSFPFTLRYYVLMYPASEEASNLTPIHS
jgi:hypothetical protein